MLRRYMHPDDGNGALSGERVNDDRIDSILYGVKMSTSLPVPDHTLLLYLAQLVMTEQINPPEYRRNFNTTGDTALWMEVPNGMFDAWVAMKNAPYEPGNWRESQLHAAYEFADSAMCVWGDYAQMLKNEIQARTGKDPGEIKTRQQKLLEHLEKFPLSRMTDKSTHWISENQKFDITRWFEHLKKLAG